MRWLQVAASVGVLFLVSVYSSPVNQDESVPASTVPSQQIVQDEVIVNSASSSPVEAVKRQDVLEEKVVFDNEQNNDDENSESDIEAEIKNFKYPLEPESEPHDEFEGIQHDEAEPLDARIMEEAGITHVVHREEDSMPYYAGRAKCRKLTFKTVKMVLPLFQK